VRRPVVPAVALLVTLAGCGEQNSYEAAEDALRDWLAAANEGDGTACDLMTPEYRQELVKEGARGTGGTCEQRIAHIASQAHPAFPPADSDIEIPVWDRSGEALAEVADPGSDRVAEFWMQYENNRWVVAGRQR
jgi:hypothetical protein